MEQIPDCRPEFRSAATKNQYGHYERHKKFR
jgi:hypothetical protein